MMPPGANWNSPTGKPAAPPGIVQNLLEFSRPASPHKKALDLSNLLERTLQLHEHSLRRKQYRGGFPPFPPIFLASLEMPTS